MDDERVRVYVEEGKKKSISSEIRLTEKVWARIHTAQHVKQGR